MNSSTDVCHPPDLGGVAYGFPPLTRWADLGVEGPWCHQRAARPSELARRLGLRRQFEYSAVAKFAAGSGHSVECSLWVAK
jgi:hypothetical protein